MKTNRIKVLAICGPTASGKSTLAIELAKTLGGEIISADSRQIYKEFDIATAKPSEEEKQGIVHHLIDVVEPTEDFTVADFADSANEKIKEIFEKGKLPIIAGGTGLYFRTLLQDFDLPRVEPDKELRAQLNETAAQKGPEVLHKILEELDPETAKNLHPNNTVKIVRAIEVSKKLNIPMSQAQSRKAAPYDTAWICLNAKNRQFLYDRIDARVDLMIEKGLEQETRALIEKYEGTHGRLRIMENTIGYAELFDYFDGACTLDTAVELIKRNSRRYAKRQLTWFRQNPDIKEIDIETCTDIKAEALRIFEAMIT